MKAEETPKSCPQESPLIELAQKGQSIRIKHEDELPEDFMGFQILPQSHRDSINTVELIDQGRIMGYDTYNSIISHKKNPDALLDDANSEYYNVTLNFVVKRQSQF